MAQYHYVIGYDDELDKWFVESDPCAYLPDGNVFFPERADSDEWGWNGWYIPDEGSYEEDIDMAVAYTLRCIVDTFPTPKENHG